MGSMVSVLCAQGDQFLTTCAQDDYIFERWSFVRYVVLGLFIAKRVLKLSQRVTQECNAAQDSPLGRPDKAGEFRQLSITLAATESFPIKFLLALCLYILLKALKLVVHFGALVLMRILPILIAHETCHCKHVKSVALSTASLFSFVPTKAFALYVEPRWYEGRSWESKLFSIAAMILFDIFVHQIVHQMIGAIGLDASMEGVLNAMGDYRVVFALCVQLCIDFDKWLIGKALKRLVYRPRAANASLYMPLYSVQVV